MHRAAKATASVSTRPRLAHLGAMLLATAALVAPDAGLAQAEGGAADGGSTIIVLDASGSMWGQIDGVAKITIAQRALSDLLDRLPDEVALGLTAYGHNRRGDCTDIETLVSPAAGTREAIRAAVNGISPIGMTPLSDAVMAAAEMLRYEERRATVILLSDGIETCDRDPCAVGAALEAAGIDFTAHVIGFDVTAEADREQLRCLAENTGGTFLVAGDAAELAQALQTVAEPAASPAPTPQPAATVDVTFLAVERKDGPPVTSGLEWSLTEVESGRLLAEGLRIDALRLSLAPGLYRAEVARAADEATATAEVTITGATPMTVALVLESALPEASIAAPAEAPAGATVLVTWEGPGDARDYLSVAHPESGNQSYVNYTYASQGSPLGLEMPPEPGRYEIRYVRSEGGHVLARASIDILPVEATLSAPASAPAGDTVQVEWTGPGYPNDYIAVARSDQADHAYINYSYLRGTSPLGLLMPPEAGTYEIRYVMAQDNTVLARRVIEIADVGAALMAPDTAFAGATVAVVWKGPAYDGDYLAVARPDQGDRDYINYSYLRGASPTDLLMPPEPGVYEIRYVMSQDGTVLMRRPIEVQPVAATLAAPKSAPAGATVQVEWSGPGYDGDYVTVARTEDGDGSYVNYTYVRGDSPLDLLMPPEPGAYEIRYVLGQDATVLARLAVTVTPVEATLTAPRSAAAGSTILVQWTGPAYAGDYVAVAEAGSDDGAWIDYGYTRDGSPATITLPEAAGTYELRYVMGQDTTVLARTVISVE